MRRRALLLLPVAAVAGVGYALWNRPGPPAPPRPGVEPVWVFEAPDRGGVVAAPLPTDDAVYLAAYRPHGFRKFGAVYALDPATGRPRWRFDHGGEMLAPASSPAVAAGRLYVGEGMHGEFACHLYCLDAATGAKVWAVPAADHIEAGPRIDGGTVYFAAGNDGVSAVDAATGERRWQYADDFHTDSTPCLVSGKVVFGTGPSRRFTRTEAIAVDARTGKFAWRFPTPLPAWGAPAAAGDRVVVPLGNGRLTEPARPPEAPAGGVVCLDAATGRELWAFAAKDAVFQQPVVDGGHVYFGSRDGFLYCLALADGAERYRVLVGGPVIAGLAVAGGQVYVASVNGVVRCLDAADGRERWHLDLGKRTATTPRVYAPVRHHRGRVYVAGEFVTDPAAPGAACLYCLPADPGGR